MPHHHVANKKEKTIVPAGKFFSVTRCFRSDVGHSITQWSLDNLTDVTLVSDYTYWRLDWCSLAIEEDEEDEEDEKDEEDEEDEEGVFRQLVSLKNKSCMDF